MAKVTVLMPVYNAQNYIEEAIESILGQTFSDFEFLIIDDGSMDRSAEIINSYHDDRIHLVQNDVNLGISKTLNKGIELASAGIIARMDADDISLPERLKIQYDFMRENPGISLVSSGVEKITGAGESIGFSVANSAHIYYRLAFHCYGIFHPTVMYRKDHIIDVGMYPETLSEDYRLWSKLIRKYRIHYMDKILVKYRITDESISHSILYEGYRSDELIYIRDNLKYFAGPNYDLPDSWLEAYRNNPLPITEKGDLKELKRCVDELDTIANFILNKENANRDIEAIKAAAQRKKKQIIELLLQNISGPKGAMLLLLSGYYQRFILHLVPSFVKDSLKEKVQNRQN